MLDLFSLVMAVDVIQKFHLKKFIKELEQFKARHTEFVSVYVPAEYDMNKVINHLAQEQGTASNIKSASTRNNVIDALERMIQHLRIVGRTPLHGLAVFSGNVAAREGQTDIRVWSIEPPVPLKIRIYRCDKDFQLDILRDMMDVKEVYGLLVMDARDSTIALLKGKSIITLVKSHSHIPGKMKAGGQCISEDSLLMLDDGDIIAIKESHNPLKIVSADLNKQENNISNITNKWVNKKALFRITTKYPRIQIDASKDHTFFVRTESGVEEKPLSKLKEGDFLIMPEKIDVKTKDQIISFVPKIKRFKDMKQVKIPRRMNEDIARLLGYYLGDGSYEIDRLTFFEQRKDVAEFYEYLIKKVFGLDSKLIFRQDKNYYQLRVYSRVVAQLFREMFPDKDKTLSGRIPSIVLKSSNSSLTQFISGFFDAEGYVSGSRVALGINNKYIVQQLQLLLLRLGIISSIWEYSNKRNPYSSNIRYTLSIDDTESVRIFAKKISFVSKEKKIKLEKIVFLRSDKSNVRQIFVNGLEVKKLLNEFKLRIRDYGLSGFLNNKRQLNKTLFRKKFIDVCKDVKLKDKLLKLYYSCFIPVKIAKITSLGLKKTVDIETSTHNFFANGILVHNSAARFQANRDIAIKAHLKKAAEHMKEQFLNREGLKGIIVGGPGPMKYEFIEGNFLTGDVKKKIIGIRDLSYTDEFGLQELVDKSQDLLAEEEIADEKKVMTRFFEILAKNYRLVSYGEKEVKKVLEMGVVDTLLLSEILDDSIIEEFSEIAKRFNTEVKIISTETREGVQLRDIGKFGAILRFDAGVA